MLLLGEALLDVPADSGGVVIPPKLVVQELVVYGLFLTLYVFRQISILTLAVTREERCVVDPASLPADARFNGTRDPIVQDLVIAVEVIRCVREE